MKVRDLVRLIENDGWQHVRTRETLEKGRVDLRSLKNADFPPDERRTWRIRN